MICKLYNFSPYFRSSFESQQLKIKFESIVMGNNIGHFYLTKQDVVMTI